MTYSRGKRERVIDAFLIAVFFGFAFLLIVDDAYLFAIEFCIVGAVVGCLFFFFNKLQSSHKKYLRNFLKNQ